MLVMLMNLTVCTWIMAANLLLSMPFYGQGKSKLFSEPTMTQEHNIPVCAVWVCYKYPSFAVVVSSYSLIDFRIIGNPNPSQRVLSFYKYSFAFLCKRKSNYSIALYHYITVYIKLIKLNNIPYLRKWSTALFNQERKRLPKKGKNSWEFYSLCRNKIYIPLGQHLANNFQKSMHLKILSLILYIRHNTFHIYIFFIRFQMHKMFVAIHGVIRCQMLH